MWGQKIGHVVWSRSLEWTLIHSSWRGLYFQIFWYYIFAMWFPVFPEPTTGYLLKHVSCAAKLYKYHASPGFSFLFSFLFLPNLALLSPSLSPPQISTVRYDPSPPSWRPLAPFIPPFLFLSSSLFSSVIWFFLSRVWICSELAQSLAVLPHLKNPIAFDLDSVGTSWCLSVWILDQVFYDLFCLFLLESSIFFFLSITDPPAMASVSSAAR